MSSSSSQHQGHPFSSLLVAPALAAGGAEPARTFPSGEVQLGGPGPGGNLRPEAAAPTASRIYLVLTSRQASAQTTGFPAHRNPTRRGLLCPRFTDKKAGARECDEVPH